MLKSLVHEKVLSQFLWKIFYGLTSLNNKATSNEAQYSYHLFLMRNAVVNQNYGR